MFIRINVESIMSVIEIDLIITKMTKSIEIIMSRQKQKKTTVRKNGKKKETNQSTKSLKLVDKTNKIIVKKN